VKSFRDDRRHLLERQGAPTIRAKATSTTTLGTALLDALPDLVGAGRYLDEVFRIVGVMDARLVDLHR